MMGLLGGDAVLQFDMFAHVGIIAFHCISLNDHKSWTSTSMSRADSNFEFVTARCTRAPSVPAGCSTIKFKKLSNDQSNI